MQILIVAGSLDRSEIALCRGLFRKGARVEILCCQALPASEELRAEGIAVQDIAIRHRFDLRAAGRLRRRLVKGDVDVLYAPRNSSLSVSLLAGSGLPIHIIGYRGTIGHLSRFDPASRFSYLSRRVDAIVCVSEAVRRYLLSFRLPPEKLVTVYKGHDPNWYTGASRKALSAFGIPPDALVVGFAGSIRPVKGVDTLVRAMDRLPPQSPLHLLLAGEMRDQRIPRLIRSSPAANRIHVTGFRKDAAALMGACDIFVMPSREREGLPRAVIEAMAQGVPPVVTDVGGMPELVVNRESGIVIPPNDPDALATALSETTDDELRRRLGLSARHRIETDFHINSTIDRMDRLFRTVAAG